MTYIFYSVTSESLSKDLITLTAVEAWLRMSVEAVKLQVRVSRGSTQHTVTVPKRFVEELGLRKGDILLVRVLEVEVDGVRRKALVYYRP